MEYPAFCGSLYSAAFGSVPGGGIASVRKNPAPAGVEKYISDSHGHTGGLSGAAVAAAVPLAGAFQPHFDRDASYGSGLDEFLCRFWCSGVQLSLAESWL